MKKVIIIGATSGIGKELAKLYARHNYLTGITGRRESLLLEIQQISPKKIFAECFDVTENNNIAHLQNLINQLGGLDILIYNSGYGEPSETLDWEIDKQTNLINVNGFTEIVNFAYNYFTKQGHGQIAAISSIASIKGNSFAPAYSASKAYISNYLQGLQIKAYKNKLNIAITDILPGFINTKMAKGNGQFWVAPVQKAVLQIYNGINNKKRRLYVTKRWWLIAQIMKHLPYFLYKKIG